MVLLPELLVPSRRSLISRRCRWLSERRWRSIRLERRAASFSSELWRHPMVLHHVVSTKEVVLLLDGIANYDEEEDQYGGGGGGVGDYFWGVHRYWDADKNLLQISFNTRQQSNHTEEWLRSISFFCFRGSLWVLCKQNPDLWDAHTVPGTEVGLPAEDNRAAVHTRGSPWGKALVKGCGEVTVCQQRKDLDLMLVNMKSQSLSSHMALVLCCNHATLLDI